MKVLVTGAAGFIGSHCPGGCWTAATRWSGVDNLNDYYDVTLKEARLARLEAQPGFLPRGRHGRPRGAGGAVRERPV